MLSLDLDRFKSVDETLGHGAIDELLITGAHRLNGCVRQMDTIARIGRDEFAILIEDLADQRDVDPLCQKVLAAMADPIVVRGEEIYATVSVGVSFFAADAIEVGELMRKADNALSRAKADGGGRFCVFTPALDSALSETLQLEAALRRAVADDAWYLCYQPKLCLQTGQVTGVEALLGWRHPRLGTVMPSKFVPPAEDPGLMRVLEITESLLLEDSERRRPQLDALKVMGVMVYLDDFSTGYSSLSYLKRYRIDGLKIDRSFIHDIPGDADDEAITRAIIARGRALRLGVIAEGVENRDQLELLLHEGCDAVQGFLFSEPLRFEEFMLRLPGGFGGDALAAVAVHRERF